MAVSDLEAEIDRLYGLPLEEFTKERNEVARRLKKADDKESAAAVQDLAKPPVAAWVVNQLARGEREAIRALLAAAEAQEKALSKGDGEALRQAMGEQREALRALGSAARRVLDEAGRKATAATIERVSSMLAAAASDRETRPLLERGRLQGEVEPSGFTALTGLPISDQRRPRARVDQAGDELAERRRQKAEATQRARQLRADLNDARRRARDAERAATKLERQADEARQKADELGAEVEHLERELEDATPKR